MRKFFGWLIIGLIFGALFTFITIFSSFLVALATFGVAFGIVALIWLAVGLISG